MSFTSDETKPTATASSKRGRSSSGSNEHTVDIGVEAVACPRCGAPMSVRRWLLMAECWQCATTLRVSFLNEEARSPVSRPHFLRRAKPVPAPTITRPAPPPTTPARAPATATPASETSRVSLLRELLACMISAIVHLLAMLLFGLLTFGPDENPPNLVLSVDFDRRRLAGERLNEFEDHLLPDFELPVSKKPTNAQEKRELVLAEADAKELRLDPDAYVPSLPTLERVRADLLSSDPYARMHRTRDPRIRTQLVEQEGGTTMTEAAVSRALWWLARHQNPEGSWSIHAFHRVRECRGRCDDRGSIRSDTGGTALALMAFLGAGQTHRTGIHQETVSRGLQFLLAEQEENGDLRGEGTRQAGMYVHGQATLVLCDAYKLSGDEVLRAPAQRAVDFIVGAQHRAGGWRYTPGERGDTSVVGWQLMALHTARAAFLDVPPQVIDDADLYLNAAQTDEEGGLYAYQPGDRTTPAMTAEGLLSRMYLGWKRDTPGLGKGMRYLVDHLPSRRDPNIYYWYYGTQALHHWGGPEWKEWNLHLRDVLVTSQKRRGHEAGSWDPRTPHGHHGGRLYMTALACCTLEVYYRHAPIYRKIVLD